MKRKTINIILSILFAVLLVLPVICFFLIEYRTGEITIGDKSSTGIITSTSGNTVSLTDNEFVLTTSEVNFQSYFINNFNIKPFTDSIFKFASTCFGYFNNSSESSGGGSSDSSLLTLYQYTWNDSPLSFASVNTGLLVTFVSNDQVFYGVRFGTDHTIAYQTSAYNNSWLTVYTETFSSQGEILERTWVNENYSSFLTYVDFSSDSTFNYLNRNGTSVVVSSSGGSSESSTPYMSFNLYFICSYLCYAFTLLVIYFVLRFLFFVPELVINRLYRRC